MPNNFWPQLTRHTKIRAGYDRTSEGYGKHPPEIDFIVKGEAGAVVYTICTGWYFANTGANIAPAYPYSVGITCHAAPTQALLAEGDPTECSHVDGGLCCARFLGSHSDLLETLKRQGDAPIFALLEEIYRQEFRPRLRWERRGMFNHLYAGDYEISQGGEVIALFFEGKRLQVGKAGEEAMLQAAAQAHSDGGGDG